MEKFTRNTAIRQLKSLFVFSFLGWTLLINCANGFSDEYIKIIDVTGKEIYNSKEISVINKNQIKIDISEPAKALYFVSIIDKTRTVNYKIIIE